MHTEQVRDILFSDVFKDHVDIDIKPPKCSDELLVLSAFIITHIFDPMHLSISSALQHCPSINFLSIIFSRNIIENTESEESWRDLMGAAVKDYYWPWRVVWFVS